MPVCATRSLSLASLAVAFLTLTAGCATHHQASATDMGPADQAVGRDEGINHDEGVVYPDIGGPPDDGGREDRRDIGVLIDGGGAECTEGDGRLGPACIGSCVDDSVLGSAECIAGRWACPFGGQLLSTCACPYAARPPREAVPCGYDCSTETPTVIAAECSPTGSYPGYECVGGSGTPSCGRDVFVCPVDTTRAIGTSCAVEDVVCGDVCCGPAAIRCEGGVWTAVESDVLCPDVECPPVVRCDPGSFTPDPARTCAANQLCMNDREFHYWTWTSYCVGTTSAAPTSCEEWEALLEDGASSLYPGTNTSIFCWTLPTGGFAAGISVYERRDGGV